MLPGHFLSSEKNCHSPRDPEVHVNKELERVSGYCLFLFSTFAIDRCFKAKTEFMYSRMASALANDYFLKLRKPSGLKDFQQRKEKQWLTLRISFSDVQELLNMQLYAMS